MDVVGVVTVKLGRDIRDTETCSHGKVRDHSDGQDQTGNPALSVESSSCSARLSLPVEDPGLPLDPHGEDPDTDETESEQGKDDPEGSVPNVGRVQEPYIRVGLLWSDRTCRCQGREGGSERVLTKP